MTGSRPRLAQRRKALGLTQEDLAELLGVDRTTVVRWERGETQPGPWIRPKLATTLRVAADRLGELLDDSGPVVSGTGRDGAATVPRQLPAAVADFTGRVAELQALTQVLDDAGRGPPGTAVISAIGGTAGVGKTALALHWAHEVADRFADGQLHVNLRGFAPAGTPATPTEAIRGFLDALGVPPDKIPPDPDAQAGLYRSLLADKRMLIVLDNASDEQQVRPLLPASPASLVIVTSRNQLTGLAAEGARVITLDVLAHMEGVELLTARIGASRTSAEPEATAEIVRLCERLPLAVAVAAARAATRPGFPLAALLSELRDAGGRLDALDVGDPAASVRTVFSWTYRQLTPDAARMFRLLGLHPGPDISLRGAVSLAAADEPETRRLLRELSRACLIAEYVPGRYVFHDLLRAYAADQARERDSDTDRSAATERFLDHYLHTGYAAAMAMSPWRDAITLSPLTRGTVPESPADYRQAMTWFEAEHDVLVAAITRAAGFGFDVHAWQLPWAMADYLDRRGRIHERVPILSTALAAATRLGDTAGEAISSRLLGHAYLRVGDYGQARVHVENSLELHRRLGDRRGAGKAHSVLAGLAAREGRYADALGHCDPALRLFRAVGYITGEAEMLNSIGWYHALLGEWQRARVFCQRSLTLSTQCGYRRTEGHTWDTLGYTEHHLGNFSEAAACYHRALDILRQSGHRYDEAATLTRLGDTNHATGDMRQARETWQAALAIFDDLGHPDAEKVRAKLTDLPPSVAE